MSIEHPSLSGWFPLQDGRNINVNQIVWFKANTQHTTADQDAQDTPSIELMLSNGTTIMLFDRSDRDNFAKLVGTIGDART